MSNVCPTCGNALDAIRAPVARIVDGKIRSYCSPACASGAATIVKVAAAAANVSDTSLSRRPTPAPAPAPTRPRAPSPAPAELTADPDERAPRSVTETRRRRNRRVLWLSGSIITGGMAVAVIQTVSPTTPAQVSAEREPTAPEREPDRPQDPIPEPPAVFDPRDRVAVAARAESELRALLPAAGAEVSRIGREAARALARTGDQAALDVLARALAAEPVGFGRVEIAYALARGGDPRGAKDLVASLKDKSRDVRADAARALVLLGDKRGIPVLESMLGLSQLEVGAAGALAPFQHKRALAILEAARADTREARREDRWRALVFLGRAGRADVAADLRAVLDQRDYKVGAAEALARLGDRAAIPVLVDDLASPSLQVGAALGLRRLDPALDPVPYLPTLVAVLDSGKDTAKVTAAEAILVLTGPAEIAERD